MTRGLHPHTRPQRKLGKSGVWAKPAKGQAVELRDAPPAAVGKALGWTLVGLLASMGLVALLLAQIGRKHMVDAPLAEMRFRTAGPPLLSDPRATLLESERAHPAPGGAALERAMRSVATRGWDAPAPAPGPAEVVRKRAAAAQ